MDLTALNKSQNYAAIQDIIVSACAAFQIPAQRINAERKLLEFQRTFHILPACRYILQNTPLNNNVVFHLTIAMRESIVREFHILSKADVDDTKNFLINYILQHNTLEKYAKKQLLNTVAVIIKRSWFNMSQEERTGTIESIVQLLTLSPDSRLVAFPFGLALLHQFSSLKCSAVGMSWEFHHACRKSFQDGPLTRLFEITLATASNLLESGQHDMLLKHVVSMFEAILQWEFVNDDDALKGSLTRLDMDLDKRVVPRLPISWRPFVMSASFVDIFFRLCVMSQSDEELMFKAYQCLIQVASIQGPIFENAEMTHHFASHFLNNTVSLLDMTTEAPSKLCIVQMIRRLIENFKLPLLMQLGSFSKLVEYLTRVTCESCVEAIEEYADTWNLETFDEALEVFSSLVAQLEVAQATGNTSVEVILPFLQKSGDQILETYLSTKMQCLDDDNDVGGYKDKDLFEDQLLSLASLTRLNGQGSLTKLGAKLDEQLKHFMSLAHQLMKQNDETLETEFMVATESLHWILLIASFLVADLSDGEHPMIPEFLFTLPDPTVLTHFVSLVMELLRFISTPPLVQRTDLLSPLLVETTFSFFERFSPSYLFPPSSDYSNPQHPLLLAFGPSGQGPNCIDFLITTAQANLNVWNTEQYVCEQISNLFSAWNLSPTICAALMQSHTWLNFVKTMVRDLHKLPPCVHGSFVESFVKMGNVPTDVSGYMQVIFQSLDDELVKLTRLPNFQQVYQEGRVVHAVQNVMDLFNGVACAITSKTAHLIVPYLNKHLGTFIELLAVYHLMPEVAFSFISIWQSATSRIDWSSTAVYQDDFLNHCVAMLKVYSHTHANQHRNATDDEEVVLDDMISILKTLSNLLSSDFGNDSNDHIAKVVLFGIDTLIPLMTKNLLQHTRLMVEYMRLVCSIAQYYPKHLAGTLPDPLFHTLMQSIEYALKNSTIVQDVFEMGMNSVAHLAKFSHAMNVPEGNRLSGALDGFMRVLVHVVVMTQYDVELVESTIVPTMYHVVVARKSATTKSFEVFFGELVKRYGGETHDVVEKLKEAFDEIVRAVVGVAQHAGDQHVRKQWNDTCILWLARVRGLVNVK